MKHAGEAIAVTQTKRSPMKTFIFYSSLRSPSKSIYCTSATLACPHGNEWHAASVHSNYPPHTHTPYSMSDYANTATSKRSTQRYLHQQQNSNLILNKVCKYVPDCDHYLNRELLESVLSCVAVSPCLSQAFASSH